MPEAKVLTVSDGVIAGTRDDRSGAALVSALEDAGYTVVEQRAVADGVDSASTALIELTHGFAGLVVTTGGTGFGPRDLTPEGTRAVLEREAPGLAEAMRLASPPRSRRRCGSSARSAACPGPLRALAAPPSYSTRPARRTARSRPLARCST